MCFQDYELQLLTYRAMVDSQHKSPLKRRRMQNSADAIVQEVRTLECNRSRLGAECAVCAKESDPCFPPSPQFMDLRTRYTAVVTSMTQYVKFASETLKRAEGEEVGDW